jgi:hypothetical protein
MPNSLIEDIKRKLIKLKIVLPQEFVGCTPDQIEEIKLSQNVTRLPAVYEDFLLTMGRGKGWYIGCRYEFLYPWLIKAKEEALESLREYHAPMPLPKDAFVFFIHDQGYEFYFFHTGNHLDMVLTRFGEG